MFAGIKRVILIAIAATAAMTLSGCATKAAEMVQVAREVEVGSLPLAPFVEGVIDGSGTGWEEPPVTERMIIWTGNISLIVKDAEESLEKAQAIAKDLGGYVVNSSSWFEDQQLRARLTIRVPAEAFDAAMDGLKDLALRVENTNISTQDVTEEYTDLDARLRNLEATEAELLELLTEVRERTGKAEDVLAVHREVSSIRGQIEQAKGRMQYLGKMTAMATIDIGLTPDALARPIVVAGWQPSGTAADALRTLVRTFQFVVDAAIWVIIYLLPTLVLIAIPFVVIRLIWRRWRKKRATA
jgi:hypothetical protein